jgi:hypothetical protein
MSPPAQLLRQPVLLPWRKRVCAVDPGVGYRVDNLVPRAAEEPYHRRRRDPHAGACSEADTAVVPERNQALIRRLIIATSTSRTWRRLPSKALAAHAINVESAAEVVEGALLRSGETIVEVEPADRC